MSSPLEFTRPCAKGANLWGQIPLVHRQSPSPSFQRTRSLLRSFIGSGPDPCNMDNGNTGYHCFSQLKLPCLSCSSISVTFVSMSVETTSLEIATLRIARTVLIAPIAPKLRISQRPCCWRGRRGRSCRRFGNFDRREVPSPLSMIWGEIMASNEGIPMEKKVGLSLSSSVSSSSLAPKLYSFGMCIYVWYLQMPPACQISFMQIGIPLKNRWIIYCL